MLIWEEETRPSMAYGSFSLVEVFSDKLLSWFPLYYHMKFAFLVWLQLPSGNGARHLYARHLRPFLLKHQDRLDHLHGFTTREITKFVINHHGEIEFLKALLKKCAHTANQMMKEVSQPVPPGGQNTIDGPNGPTRPPGGQNTIEGNRVTRPHIQDPSSDADNWITVIDLICVNAELSKESQFRPL